MEVVLGKFWLHLLLILSMCQIALMRLFMHKLILERFALFLLGSLLLANDALAQPISASIIDGTRTSEATFPYVARLMIDGQSLCSGTLITSRHVLTAAHCFYSRRQDVGDTGYTVRLNGREYRSKRVAIHPTYRPHGSDAVFEGEADAAIIELAHEVSGITPVPILSSPVPVGATVLLVGYGLEGTGSTGQSQQQPSLGEVSYGFTVVEGYGDQEGEQNPNSLYFYWRFDSGESTLGGGDSGGPAFYDLKGSRYLVGISCGGSGFQFSSYSVDTRTDLIKHWIDEITRPVDPVVLSISNASLTLDPSLPLRPSPASDMLKISGKIFVGSAFPPRGRRISLKVGSNNKSFRLDSTGRSAATRGGYFHLRGAQSRGRFVRSTIDFDAMLNRDAISEITRQGFARYYPFEGRVYVLPIAAKINGREISASPELIYTKRVKKWLLVRR